jgi:hypothetical protein
VAELFKAMLAHLVIAGPDALGLIAGDKAAMSIVDYDLVTVSGDLGGAASATVMANAGG